LGQRQRQEAMGKEVASGSGSGDRPSMSKPWMGAAAVATDEEEEEGEEC